MKTRFVKAILTLALALLSLPMQSQNYLKIYFKDGHTERHLMSLIDELSTSKYDKEGLLIDAILDYNNKIIGTQSYSCVLDGSKTSVKDFIDNVSKSRSFGGYAEWEWCKKHGMGRGCNLHNVIAINERWDATMNKLYYPDEFVRHKVIDIVGDMFTSGGFIYGWVQSYKGSHALNNLLLRKLFSDKSNYEIIEPKGEKK